MARIQDSKHLNLVLDRYLNFKMDDLTLGHIAKNVFAEYPVSENMRDNLTFQKYKVNKEEFKRALQVEKEDLLRKSTNIGTEGFMAQAIYVKLASLITKMLESETFSKI